MIIQNQQNNLMLALNALSVVKYGVHEHLKEMKRIKQAVIMMHVIICNLISKAYSCIGILYIPSNMCQENNATV